MLAILYICLAGGCGALARFTVGYMADRVIPATSFPIATVSINILGSGLLGIATGLLAPTALLFQVASGFLGGFSTFSTFTNDFIKLMDHRPFTAISYLVLSATLGVASAFVGYELVA